MAIEITFSWGIRSINTNPPGYKIGEAIPYEVKQKHSSIVGAFYVEFNGYVDPNFLKKLELHADKSTQGSNGTGLFISPKNILRFLDYLLLRAETDPKIDLSFKKENIDSVIHNLNLQGLISGQRIVDLESRFESLPGKREQLIAERAKEQQVNALREILTKELKLYFNSRGSLDAKNNVVLNWITRIFRNSDLSKQKAKLVDRSCNQLKKAKTVEDFESIVSKLDARNTSLEKEHKKTYGFFKKSNLKQIIDTMSDSIKNYNGMR